MTQDTSLSELVLGYCRQVGALVEPPAYGMYELSCPMVAARWVAPFQRFVFDAADNHAGVAVFALRSCVVETIVDNCAGRAPTVLYQQRASRKARTFRRD